MKIDKDGAAAIAEAVKPMLGAELDSRMKGVAKADDLKPLLERITDLETKSRSRPITDSDDDQPRIKGVPVRPLYHLGRYKGHFAIPNLKRVEAENFRLSLVLRYLRNQKWDANVGVEKDVFEEVAKQKAALQLGDDSAAGFYIPNEVMDAIIDPLRATGVKSQLGLQMMTGLTNSPIEFPRQVGVETAYMVGEDVEVTHSNQTADQISLNPHMAAVLTSASASLLQKAPGVVENRIRRSITRTMELKEDSQLFEGSGIGANVLGLLNIVGALTVNISGHAASTIFPMLHKCIAQLEGANVEISGGKWAMHAYVWHTLWNNQLTQIAAGNHEKFLSIENGATGIPQKFLLGYPVVICNSIAASTTSRIFFCNWPEVMWAEWLNPGIAFSDQADDAFKKVKGYFRIVKEFDANVEHPEVICLPSAFTYLTFS